MYVLNGSGYARTLESTGSMFWLVEESDFYWFNLGRLGLELGLRIRIIDQAKD